MPGGEPDGPLIHGLSMQLAIGAVGTRDDSSDNQHEHDESKDEVGFSSDEGVYTERLSHHEQPPCYVKRRHGFVCSSGKAAPRTRLPALCRAGFMCRRLAPGDGVESGEG